MFIKFTSVLASIFFSGTVVWAYMPVSSPQPASLSMAVNAAMGPVTAALPGQDPPPTLTCEDQCLANLDEDLELADEESLECLENAAAAARLAAELCLLLGTPEEVSACLDVVAAILSEVESDCGTALDDEIVDIYNEFLACMEACLE